MFWGKEMEDLKCECTQNRWTNRIGTSNAASPNVNFKSTNMVMYYCIINLLHRAGSMNSFQLSACTPHARGRPHVAPHLTHTHKSYIKFLT